MNIIFKYIEVTVVAIVLVFSISSCKKDEGIYYNYHQEKPAFNGSVLKYLESVPGVYDSMMVVINRVPGLRDSLSENGLTVFAITNDSFKSAINELNVARKRKELEPVFLKNMDVLELDTMICRYIFKQTINTENLRINSGGLSVKSIKFNHQMFCQLETMNASGVVGAGAQWIVFSDTHNSVLSKNWDETFTNSQDLITNNGIVHGLIAGHTFGFNEFTPRLNK